MDSKVHARFCRRICHGGTIDTDTPSLPLTEVVVDYIRDTMPGTEGLGRLDMETASNLCEQDGVTPSTMAMSTLYVKRLKQRNPQYMQSISSSDIFFISMMMASKYLYDEGVEEEVFNDEWADQTGQEVDDINQLELEFLDALDWHLFVRPEEFEDALRVLERRLALNEGVKRGWFTYTEMTMLLDKQLLSNLWNQVGVDCTKLATVLSTAYLASLLSMLGSVAVAAQLSGPLATAVMATMSLHSYVQLPEPSASSLLTVASSLTLSGNLSDNSVGLPLLVGPHSHNATMSAASNASDATPDALIGVLNGKQRAPMMAMDGERPLLGEASFDPASSVQAGNDQGSQREGTGGSTTAKMPRSSVLSLWFFDSLLSQIWAVLKPRNRTSSPSPCSDCGQKLPTPTSRKNVRCQGDLDTKHQNSCTSCQLKRHHSNFDRVSRACVKRRQNFIGREDAKGYECDRCRTKAIRACEDEQQGEDRLSATHTCSSDPPGSFSNTHPHDTGPATVKESCPRASGSSDPQPYKNCRTANGKPPSTLSTNSVLEWHSDLLTSLVPPLSLSDTITFLSGLPSSVMVT